jgi:aspartate aminotransferase
MPISKRVNKIGVSPTMKVFAEAKAMQSRGENVINFSVGEPDFPTPSNIKEAAKKAIDNNQTRYTLNQGTIELRIAVAEKLKKKNGLDYLPENIIVSTGAKQSLYNAILSLVHDDDEVIFSSPYYVSYPEMISLANGKSVILPTTEATGFNFSAEQLEKAITPKSKVVILSYPSNPTGACFTKEELIKLSEIIAAHKLYVICDDIYENFIYDDNRFFSFASVNERVKERTIVVNGFSKTYAMTGWRIGYAAGPEKIISAMNKIQSHSTSNASSISQAAGLEALNGPQDFIPTFRHEFEQRRNLIFERLISIEGITAFKPKGAFYIFPNVSYFFGKLTSVLNIKDSFDLAMYLLYEAKVATVPGSAFGAEGYLRISFSTSKENLETGAERIKNALAKLS